MGADTAGRRVEEGVFYANGEEEPVELAPVDPLAGGYHEPRRYDDIQRAALFGTGEWVSGGVVSGGVVGVAS